MAPAPSECGMRIAERPPSRATARQARIRKATPSWARDKAVAVRIARVPPIFKASNFRGAGLSRSPLFGSRFENRFVTRRGGSRTARSTAGMTSVPTECGTRNSERGMRSLKSRVFTDALRNRRRWYRPDFAHFYGFLFSTRGNIAETVIRTRI